MMVVVVIVLFGPSQDVFKSLEILLETLNFVIVVNNNKEPLHHEKKFPEACLHIINNNNNNGLAGAYNKALDYIYSKKVFTHILFLDQDSDVSVIKSFLQDKTNTDLLNNPEVAAISPVYIDRKTKLRGRYIKLGKIFYRVFPRDFNKITDVSFLINSMSFWKISAIDKIGSYSHQLSIDHIDTDYCIRATILGYKLYINPNFEFLHSIGERKKYKFLKMVMQSGGHDTNRRFLIAKNTVLLGKRYFINYPSFTILCMSRIVYEILGILILENNKFSKVSALLAGVLSGITTKYINNKE